MVKKLVLSVIIGTTLEQVFGLENHMEMIPGRDGLVVIIVCVLMEVKE